MISLTRLLVRYGVATALIFATVCTAALAQIPRTLNYQGYLTNPSGGAINDPALAITVKLYEAASGGSALYSETQSLAVVNGIFNMVIGSVSPLTLEFDKPYFLGVTVGADAEMSPRQPLTASPYAFNAFAARTANAPVSADNTINVVDATIGAGYDNSIAIGPDGFPVISYYQNPGAILKVAKCSNLACSGTVTPVVVDNTGDVGRGSSITIGGDGMPIISYYDNTNARIKVAKCQTANCSSAVITSLAPALVVTNLSSPITSSISIGSDGLAIISYTQTNAIDGVRVAKCSNPSCTAATFSTPSAGRGLFTGVVHGADNLPRLVTGDTTGLRVYKCTDLACSASSPLGNASGLNSATMSLAIDGSVLAAGTTTAASPFEVRIVRCDASGCSASTLLFSFTSVVTGGGNFPGTDAYTLSTTVGSDGLPLVVFRDSGSGILYVVRCIDARCTSGPASAVAVDTAPSRKTYSSIAIGSDGLPVISYIENTTAPTPVAPRLKVLKCGNPACGIVRRR